MWNTSSIFNGAVRCLMAKEKHHVITPNPVMRSSPSGRVYPPEQAALPCCLVDGPAIARDAGVGLGYEVNSCRTMPACRTPSAVGSPKAPTEPSDSVRPKIELRHL